MTISSLLIVKLGAVGDCVHALYALRALRSAYPNAKIGWVVEEKSLGVVEGHPDLDELIVFPRKEVSTHLKAGRLIAAIRVYWDFRREIRKERYQVVVDFQNLFKSGLVALSSGSRKRIGFWKLREANFLFTNHWVSTYPNAPHAIEKYFCLLRPLGIERISESVHVHIPPEKMETADRFWVENDLSGRRVVAVNPEASWPSKKLELEKYAETIDDLSETGVKSLILWGPNERESAENLRSLCRSEALLAPLTDIKELYYLLKRCDVYFGNDSGPMHLAAAAGIGVAAVFGPSDPGRVGPWTDKSVIISSKTPCSPCWKRKCPMHHQRCMTRITAKQLTQAVHRLLEA
jgi:lipopolysaccharide heptosyltransferase I